MTVHPPSMKHSVTVATRRGVEWSRRVGKWVVMCIEFEVRPEVSGPGIVAEVTDGPAGLLAGGRAPPPGIRRRGSGDSAFGQRRGDGGLAGLRHLHERQAQG